MGGPVWQVIDVDTSLQDQSAELAPISTVDRLHARARALYCTLAGTAVSGAISRRLGLALAVAAVGFVFYRVSAFERDYLYSLLADDAYISARHAQNLVAGHGLNYNAGERVEGYSNFLFTVLMAVPHALGGSLEPFMRALGLVTIFAVLGLTYHLARGVAGWIAPALLVAALVLDQRFVFFAIWGLESGFVCLPCLLGYAFLFRSRHVAAGIAFAAAAMTRIDMVVVAAPAFLYALFQRSEHEPVAVAAKKDEGRLVSLLRVRPGLVRLAATFGTCFGGYFLIRWHYYGWLLPNTFYAKVGEPANAWERGLAYVLECFSKMGISWLLVAAGCAWVACIAALMLNRERRSAAWPDGFRQALVFAAAACGYVAYAVTVGGDHFKERFIYHPIPFLLMASAAPFWWLAEFVLPKRASWRRFAAVPSAGFALVMAATLASHPHRFNRAGGAAAWASLGKYLKQNARPDAVLATDAAGALPYYSGLKTIDMLGLADIHTGHMEVATLGRGPTGHEKMDRPYVLSRKPDYISTWFGADGFAGRSLGHEPGFNEQYRLAALVRTDSSELSTDRVLPITDPEPPRSELVALREGKGQVRGRYDWALYERRKPGAYAPLPVTGFRSNLPGWKRSDRLIVAAPKGHVPAHIMWGPFLQLPRGSYGGYVKMELGRVEGLASWQRLCGFDVYDGKRSLTQAQLLVGLPAAARARKIDFTFEVRPEDESRKIEFRMYCWGLADVTVESVLIAQKP